MRGVGKTFGRAREVTFLIGRYSTVYGERKGPYNSRVLFPE
jgi:hypothetical protein